jgi:hypothetical protein
VFIETKNWDWFYDAQLETHLESLAGEPGEIKVLLALGNFDTDAAARFGRIRSICTQRYRGTILFQDVSLKTF